MDGKEPDEELDIPWLVDHFSQMTYHTTVVDPHIDRIEEQCRRLFGKDYNVELLSNQVVICKVITMCFIWDNTSSHNLSFPFLFYL